MHLPGYQPTTDGNQKQIRLAAKALANARRPVIYAGGGVVSAGMHPSRPRRAGDPPIGFPVTCTVMGLGGFPAPHEQWLGMLGMHGTRTANYAMDEADLIVAIGARFDDRITGKLSEFAPRAKFIHIDVDPAEISKNVPAHIPIVGDAGNILPRLVAEYRALEPEGQRLEEWWGRIRSWQQRYPLTYEDSKDAEIKPQYMVQALYAGHRAETRSSPRDVGQHQMWAAQYYQFRRGRADGSRPVASAPWASACRRRSGAKVGRARTSPSSASPATASSDEHAGARDLRAEDGSRSRCSS